jgi:hypothetical protein
VIDEDETVAVADAARRAQLTRAGVRVRRQPQLNFFLFALSHDALIVRRLVVLIPNGVVNDSS